MTKREKCVVSAYTGVLMCDFADLHQYIEQLLGRPVWTHELAFSDVLAALERQKCSDRWQRDGGQYIPDPTTWLNGRRWEDELFPAEPERPTPPDDARRGRCL